MTLLEERTGKFSATHLTRNAISRKKGRTMATLDELYSTVLADEAERAAFAEAAKTPEGLSAFLAERGCDATPEQLTEFLKAKAAEQGEITDAELDSVAGGCNKSEAITSVLTFGVVCAVVGAMSAARNDSKGDNGKILCNTDLYY